MQGSSPLTRGALEEAAGAARLAGLIPAHAGSTLRWAAPRPWVTAHPRSRGEHPSSHANHSPAVGSSPLTRGAHGINSAARVGGGLIPAHAGSTAYEHPLAPVPPAHPRSRGEHNMALTCAGSSAGSSPLTRGALRQTDTPCRPGGSSPLTRGARTDDSAGLWCGGLIPAHAGSTVSATRPASRSRAHPRSRGEHTLTGSSTATLKGSSPLTRGALLHSAQSGDPFGSSPLTRGAQGSGDRHLRPPGLIPAHAGSTGVRLRLTTQDRAHPRSRGEHPPGTFEARPGAGSSPLTRGALWCGLCAGWASGLIPAHAGSTQMELALQKKLRAHPRSRGEHKQLRQITSPKLGSSPLTRGALNTKVNAAFLSGLIPAHAGSTSPHDDEPTTDTAHPRSRGEHFGRQIGGIVQWGSSPLTRGALSGLPQHCAPRRLIPAHAGSTCAAASDSASTRAHPRSRGEHAARML